MKEISKVLCVVDPESDEQPSVERSAWLAKQLGARLELLVCYYNEYLSDGRLSNYAAVENAHDELLGGLKEKLEKSAGPLRDGGLEVTTAAKWDHPLYQGVVRHAIDCEADIVFKDTHHHSALTRALLSNTDWNLIRTCPVPLWLVKPKALSATPTFVAAIDPMHEHDKPAALDDEILIVGKSIAAATGAVLHAFHAYDPRIAVATATANAYIPVSLPFDEIEKQMHEQHEKRFSEITAFHEIDDAHSKLVAGVTHEELPEFAAGIEADVVIMGAVSRNRWKRLFIGSTAERTLEHLPCDLLVIKPDWFHTPSEIADERGG